jgi:hypothetical protein
VLIRASLLRPRFSQLLDVAHEFGLARVEAEWRLLLQEGTTEARRAETTVERILSNIRKGIDVAAIEESGFSCESRTNPAAAAEFIAAGLDLADFQQDYLVGGVKVSFFAAETSLANVLNHESSPTPRIATLDEIFASKCLVSAKRSRTRDWLDLYVLLRDHAFTMRDYVRTFDRVRDPTNAEIGLVRLCSGQPDLADEGLSALMPSPPTVEEMRDFFRRGRDQLEVDLAREKFSKPV